MHLKISISHGPNIRILRRFSAYYSRHIRHRPGIGDDTPPEILRHDPRSLSADIQCESRVKIQGAQSGSNATKDM